MRTDKQCAFAVFVRLCIQPLLYSNALIPPAKEETAPKTITPCMMWPKVFLSQRFNSRFPSRVPRMIPGMQYNKSVGRFRTLMMPVKKLPNKVMAILQVMIHVRLERRFLGGRSSFTNQMAKKGAPMVVQALEKPHKSPEIKRPNVKF